MTLRGMFSVESIALGGPPPDLLAQIGDPAGRAVIGDWYEDRGVDARSALEDLARIRAIFDRLNQLSTGARQAEAESRRLSAERLDLQRRLRDRLAAARGWKVAERRFTFDELATGRRASVDGSDYSFDAAVIESGGSGIIERRVPDMRDLHGLLDHEEHFRAPRAQYARAGEPAGILTHSYRDDDLTPFVALADRAGLTVEFLPWSWYFPGYCVTALFTRPATWKQAPSRIELQRARAARRGIV